MPTPDNPLTEEEDSVWQAVHTAVHQGKCTEDGWVELSVVELTVPHRITHLTTGSLVEKGALEVSGSGEKVKYRL